MSYGGHEVTFQVDLIVSKDIGFSEGRMEMSPARSRLDVCQLRCFLDVV